MERYYKKSEITSLLAVIREHGLPWLGVSDAFSDVTAYRTPNDGVVVYEVDKHSHVESLRADEYGEIWLKLVGGV